MSTEYAVRMSLSAFVVAAQEQGFTLEGVVENGHPRLRLVDGSATGYVYDPREEKALDGKVWTLFTRYGLNDVSGLSIPLGAVDEHSNQFHNIHGWSEDQARKLIGDAVDRTFQDVEVSQSQVAELLGMVLAKAQAYRDEVREWAVGYENEPLPVVLVGREAAAYLASATSDDGGAA